MFPYRQTPLGTKYMYMPASIVLYAHKHMCTRDICQIDHVYTQNSSYMYCLSHCDVLATG